LLETNQALFITTLMPICTQQTTTENFKLILIYKVLHTV